MYVMFNLDKKYEAINWNSIEEDLDKDIWDVLIQQFWVDTRIPVSKDLTQWNSLTQKERDLFLYVFGGLTLLDTLQSEEGVDALKQDVRTKHEEAVLNNILFMEALHSKAYSSIFSTLADKQEIDEVFRWVKNHPVIQKKAKMIDDVYKEGTPLQKKVASVFLESFLFYSGFYTPLLYAGKSQMVNTGEVISLIIKDENYHSFYIGMKYQYSYNELSEKEQSELRDWVYSFLYELYELETTYTEEMYDDLGMSEDVKVFLRYNANKALMNLGHDSLFPDEEVNPLVINGLNTGTSTQDFFSTVGNGYLVGLVENMKDSDYDY